MRCYPISQLLYRKDKIKHHFYPIFSFFELFQELGIIKINSFSSLETIYYIYKKNDSNHFEGLKAKWIKSFKGIIKISLSS